MAELIQTDKERKEGVTTPVMITLPEFEYREIQGWAHKSYQLEERVKILEEQREALLNALVKANEQT